jgi:homopolymeric O-antigen transport system ATP-binding protein
MSATPIAIRVEGLGKRYRIGERWSAGGWRRWRPGGRRDDAELWALRDVSFDLERGQALGVIGRNGAGKSTLLKILSRITRPSAGHAEIRGRVGSLLEVGTGFHPELTGRENIYLNGAILGMRKREIDRKLPDIVAFAEIERFLDTPVKFYSSGMYVRLAFAVAAHLEPETLLVDEVLAVGDAAFQAKCLARIGDATTGGATVLFVSHNMNAVARLCTEAIWLDGGTIRQRGSAHDVVEAYLSEGLQENAAVTFEANPESVAQLLGIEMLNSAGQLSNVHSASQPFRVRLTYLLRQRLTGYRLAVRLRLADGFDVLTSATTDADATLLHGEPGVYAATVSFPPRLLAAGRYLLTAVLGQPGRRTLDLRENILVVQVEGSVKAFVEPDHGVISTLLDWSLEAAGTGRPTSVEAGAVEVRRAGAGP